MFLTYPGLGSTLVLIVTPATYELEEVIEQIEKRNLGVSGVDGTYTQAFILSHLSMAAATVFGTLLSGTLSHHYGWKTMTLVMGLFSFTGAISSVSPHSITLENQKTLSGYYD